MTTTTAPALDVVEPWRDAHLAAVLAGHADAVTLLAGLGDVRVRDCILWTAVHEPATLPADVLGEACRAASRHLVETGQILRAAPALSVAAIAAWMDGDDVAARTLVGAARTIDPDYSLAVLLEAAHAAGLPVERWTESLAGLTFDQCRHGA